MPSKYLLDTCVLRELSREKGNRSVRRFVRNQRDADLYLSAITVGELAKGGNLLASGGRRENLALWLQTVLEHSSERIIPVRTDAAILWGRETARAQQHGRTKGAIDLLIAATALEQDLTLVTRNVSDFAATGVRLHNPWA